MRDRLCFQPRFLLVLAGLLAVACGEKFELPTESGGGFVPADDAFTLKGSLENVPDPTDVLITRSSGNQLLVVRGANEDTRDSCNQVTPLTSGQVELYPIFSQENTPPISIAFNNLLRPQLASENGGRLFVFDAGDTCACEDLDSIPRVVGYQIGVSDPAFTIIDTSLALLLEPELLEREGQKSPWVDVRGLAVADDRTVYVSGTFKLLARDEFGRFTLQFDDRIWRYREVTAGQYERDEDWEVLPGTGVGFVENHQGIAWGPTDDPYLWVADGAKQAIQKLEIETDSESHGVYAFDGTLSGERFSEPTDVGVDEDGFVYVVDRGSARVLRFEDLDFTAEFVQQVNVRVNETEPALMQPNRGAVLDTIVYVSDPPVGAARRYERRDK